MQKLILYAPCSVPPEAQAFYNQKDLYSPPLPTMANSRDSYVLAAVGDCVVRAQFTMLSRNQNSSLGIHGGSL